MQKSIEDLEVTVKENKNEIKSLMDRTKALETQKVWQNQRVNRRDKQYTTTSEELQYPYQGVACTFFTQAIQPTLEFAKLKGELSQVPEYEKVIEHGHIRPSRPYPAGSKRSQTGPLIIILRFLSRTIQAKVIKNNYPAFKPSRCC